MQNKTYNTRALAEAGLTIALTVIIMLVNIYVPIASLVANFIVPIPITILYIRHNYKVTLISVIASGIFIAMFYNPIYAISSMIMVGFTGVVLGYCVKNKKNFGTTIIFLSIAMALGTTIYTTIYITLMSNDGIYGFVSKIVKNFNQSMEISKSIYQQAGVSSSQLAPIEDLIKMFTPEYIMRLIPGVIIASSVILAYLNYTITRAVLKKLKYEVNEAKPFNQWYMNTRIGTLVGVILVLGILFNRNNMAIGQYLINSSGLILELVFLLDGVSLVTYYLMNRYKVSKKIIVLIIVFTVMTKLSLVYGLAGFIDMVFDFRKLDPYRKLKK
ncbi:YybS family protein [Clostridium coskatii]|uniref:DUF2232 domain-containing protein n=1 Tax=Clostridium coskatii TaxID=1705578 RepID=A0A166T3L0_9CLOT|nr:YybS family protein [Clostridium coskatii]OAA93143.1 hypothetical protein WX73_00470 [Clostridium coskatii]OBR90887.1 hypothetical protein CLCOS_38700 [Clostridium coskatii]